MEVHMLYRYPVKSMLGESLASVFVDECGADGDRRLALVDAVTGRIASAKQPRLWRQLLQFSASWDTGGVRITPPGAASVAADDPGVDDLLSGLLGRAVRLISGRPRSATLERPDPEKVLDLGVDAEVEARIVEIAGATPGDSFTDLAPLHAITTATIERVGVAALRYRPNLVIATPPGYPPYAENQWVGRELAVRETRLRVLKPTSRCAVPTLEHGPLPSAPQALRTLIAENRLAAPASATLPCAGVYLSVLTEGVIHIGDQVTLN
ncbi:molybdenum cofactor biosysynthesis protein [Mycobacterium heckeshornense]|uniref:Molybdenum cofactor biosysynthesis protein n=1 Tax=Mycobacterium heckeshornense TaxID=110505 RepID=A0A2G8BDH1_9MYCO|nr:MOSC N-terminal beta barrel domain-containing protein [Mycobacterium heckeshornense]KMV20958.1 molybdenum cofactor biosysynthesis protein [Mycobacterium heckeshornense]MCV7036215.1 MOSC domain-containing protein [Mycobacterium heckeshornense]PIJ35821.1 molybdenum cofactor biosysynthesis protein [Mycobacterium heckeshornense]BCO36000.1 molybdenum cofactor biosysynthesis protein [Mycobacterium heckeshornense]